MATIPGLFRLRAGVAATVMLAAIALEAGALAIPAGAGGGPMPQEIIATQIRQQGFTCEKPKSAERDSEESKPGAVVWILTCENATYKVRLRPNMAADVEKTE